MRHIEAEDLAREMFTTVAEVTLADSTWNYFGYKGRPRRGKIFLRFVDKQALEEEDFLLREFMVVTLVEMSSSIRDAISADLISSIVARTVELLIDGLDPSTPFWSVFRFPSREAAQRYFQKGMTEYLELNDLQERMKLFSSRMTDVVPTKQRGIWMFGVAQLFTSSPVSSLYSRMMDLLDGSSIIGQVALQDDLYINLVEHSLGLE
jgi:hypothetical protein